MSQSLREFSRFMAEQANTVGNASSELAVKVATAIIRDLTNVTPVDTSQAISNWQLALTTKNSSRIAPYFFGKFGSTQELSSAEAVLRAIATLKAKKPGQEIHIFNNLPYIRRLDEGSSTQQPAGFVARAELLGRKVAEKG